MLSRSQIIDKRYNFLKKYLVKLISQNNIADDIWNYRKYNLNQLNTNQKKILMEKFNLTKLIKFNIGNGFTGQVFIKCDDMISYVQHLRIPNWKIGVLNMANATTPGGGFISGARAQEEALCSRTDLYIALLMGKQMGNYPLKIGHSFVIDGVNILLDNNFRFIQNNKNLTIISAAAKHYSSENEANLDKQMKDIIVQNWLSIIYAGSLANIDELVISALGCGAFNNPPEEVASQLFNALRICVAGNIKKISVIIFDDHNGQRKGGNFERFSKSFIQKYQQENKTFNLEY